ncbi:aminotransferase class V-fold PLP-dependent enzyme [Mycoplasma enhydrae]|uniref:aminotransferase class V-fold PLP-dependent enzyme n=1 Tax=Mycoplasma enhydrae TaxID=2499220 RepID=UPI0021E94446|nr:aminotransferase class V-fold PLP-dependent enzyme [Mycoplasma enhydrae]MCV3733465.1 aminotransferase class V-fold PLP-dependent enzyme [Mycoplasma enhydrae]
MDIKKIRNLFPMFKNNPNIVYLDNAALTFKPQIVIDKGTEFYEKYSISTRTADTKIGFKVKFDLENTRNEIAKFINSKPDEVIFTSGTTESLNLIAKMLSSVHREGKIIFSYFNHSSAIIPFIENFKNSKLSIEYAFDEKDILNKIDFNTKIVVLAQTTNNFQVHYDMKKIYEKCKSVGANLINDAAQAIVRDEVNLDYCDVLAFSGNKLYGPTGTGVLAIKNDLLKKLSPQKWGGGQVQNILKSWQWTIRETIGKWEPGTPNIAGILQLGEAIKFFKSFNFNEIKEHEKAIAEYAFDKLLQIPNIKIDSKRGDTIILFNIKGIPSQEISHFLGQRDIYVRSGSFCAYKFKEVNKYNNDYVRISLALYNNKKDIDSLVSSLKKGGNFIEIF